MTNMTDKDIKTSKNKTARRAAIKKVNKIIKDKESSQIKYTFQGWIPKNSNLKTPVRFYINNSLEKDYIAKYKNKLIIYSASKTQPIKVENFLLDHDIDIKSMKSMGELNQLLKDKNLLVKNRQKEAKKSSKNKTIHNEKEKRLSKLRKGDKIHAQHANKEIIITVTHIEVEKGVPTVNFTCSGDEDIHITTEFKGRNDNKNDRLHGSNKGRGWSKGNNYGVKK